MTKKQQDNRLLGCLIMGAVTFMVWLACLFLAFYLGSVNDRPWWIWPARISLLLVWALFTYIGMIIVKVACRTAEEKIEP